MGRFLIILFALLATPLGAASVADASCEFLLARVRQHAGKMLSRKEDGVESTSLNGPHSDKIRLDVRGVPYWVKLVPVVEGLKLRHYVGVEEWRQGILETQKLIAGPTPYVRSDYPPRWFIEKYLDVTGVFLTTRELGPDQVGVFSTSYVEVELLPGTPLIELEKDRIYLIPGPPGTVVPVVASPD